MAIFFRQGDQFCSVFTKEDISDLPDLGPSSTPSVPPIKVNIKEVLKLLKDISPIKQLGLIPARLLKEAAEDLAPGLTHLFHISIDSGKIPSDWARKWQMAFNADKCEVLRITNKRRPICADYYIHSQKLAMKTDAKYLGVTICNDLSWSKHTDNVAKNANSTMEY